MSDEEFDDNEEAQLLEEEKKIKEALKYTSFETLLNLRREAKLPGVQRRSRADSAPALVRPDEAKKSKKGLDKKDGEGKEKKKRDKSKPIVRSAKIPVSRRQQVFEQHRPKGRDPRFDGLSGKLNTSLFEKSYDFLNDLKKHEIQVLQGEVKKKKYNEEQKKTLKQALGNVKSDLQREQKRKIRQEVKTQYKKRLLENVKKGKKAFYPKNSLIREGVLKKDFDKLENEGKIDKILLEKRRIKGFKLRRAYNAVAEKKIKKE